MKTKDIIEGLLIIQKHVPEDQKDGYWHNQGHDQIWCGEFDWVPIGKDAEILVELGWFEDEDSWSCFT